MLWWVKANILKLMNLINSGKNGGNVVVGFTQCQNLTSRREVAEGD